LLLKLSIANVKPQCQDDNRAHTWSSNAEASVVKAGMYTILTGLITFYRVMHYSAKRGLEIACHLSVCPVDRDHVG